MHRMKRLFAGIAMLAFPVVLTACATPSTQVQVKSAVIARVGDTVRLFYGGTKQAREEFCTDQVVPVYRYEGTGYTGREKVEEGKVRITKVLDDQYLEGVVTEGRVRNDDIAQMGGTSCLVRLPGTGEN